MNELIVCLAFLLLTTTMLPAQQYDLVFEGGRVMDPETGMDSSEGVTVIRMPVNVTALQAPVIFAVPMQLLAYHVAVLKGTDVDQPRNLAKSLTVE